MIAVERVVPTERQPDSVQAQRITLADSLDDLDLRAAVGEIVLAVRFEPANRRALGKQLGCGGARRPIPACAGSGPQEVAGCEVTDLLGCSLPCRLVQATRYFGAVDPLLRRSRPADDPFAGTGRESSTHSLPFASFLLWPAHEWPLEAQSFLPAFAMP